MTLPARAGEVLLLHNPRCSKSRALKAALEARGVAFAERLYLDQPLSLAELKDLHRRLGGDARALLRKDEPELAAAGLDASSGEGELLAAVARFPKLLERPVLVNGPRAALGRPAPEDALRIL